MLNAPEAPRSGEPVKAQFFKDLIEWIKDSVTPRGDGLTTRVTGNIIHALNTGTVSADTGTQFSCRCVVNGDGTRSIEVYDGTDPASEYCGSMLDRDRGTVLKRIAKTTLTLPDCTTSGTVHLLLLDYVPYYDDIDIANGKTSRAVRILFVPAGSYLLLNQNNVDLELASVTNTEQDFSVTQNLERCPFTVAYASLQDEMFGSGFYCRFVETMLTPAMREIHVEVVDGSYLTRAMQGDFTQGEADALRRPTRAGVWFGVTVPAQTFTIPVSSVSDFLSSKSILYLVLDLHNIKTPSVHLLEATALSGTGYRIYDGSRPELSTWGNASTWPEKILLLPLADLNGPVLSMRTYLPHGRRRGDYQGSLPSFFNLTDFLVSQWRIEPQYTVTENKQGRSVCYEKSSVTGWKVRCPYQSYAGKFSFPNNALTDIAVPETTFTKELNPVRLYAYLTYSDGAYQAGLYYSPAGEDKNFGDGPARALDENKTLSARIGNGIAECVAEIEVTGRWL